MAIFISQKCRRSERYFRYKNTCPMLIKLGNIRKVFCMNGFPRMPEKKGHKTRRNESGNMAKSYFIYCIQSNLYHGLYRVRVFGSRRCLRDRRRGQAIVLSACLYFTTTCFPVSGTNCIEYC